MPTPTRPRTGTGPPRRALLTAGLATGAALVAGSVTACSSDTPPRPSAPPDDRPARRRAARDTAALLAWYDATLAAHPALAPRLRPLRAEVVRHLAAFDGHATRGRAGQRVPTDADAAVVALARATRRSADQATTALLDAPPELARLLASVAAARAGQVLLLES